MNKVQLIGYLARDPEVRQGGTNNDVSIARYTLAVGRRYKREGGQNTDYINCVCFGKSAQFVEKYLTKGMKIAVVGSIRTGSYEKDGHKVFTTDVVVEEHEFCESRSGAKQSDDDGFMKITENDDNLPFG